MRIIPARKYLNELHVGDKKQRELLTDIERKVLRILYNDTRGEGSVPSIHKLSARTGKGTEAIHVVLQSLVDKGFINWLPDRHSDLQVLKAWEDHHAPAVSKRQANSEYYERGY